MTPNQLLTAITRALESLQDAGLATEITAHQAVLAARSCIVSFVGSDALGALMPDFGSVAEYEGAVRGRLFSALLTDGALLQMTYMYERTDIVKHRLAYSPCPYRFDPEELEAFSLIELLDAFAASAPTERIRLESCIRFDYDLHGAHDDHPASHVTLNRDTCRIPVLAPLSPGHFVRFVVQHFYATTWSQAEAIRTSPCETVGSTFSGPNAEMLFVNWQRGGGLLKRVGEALRPKRASRS